MFQSRVTTINVFPIAATASATAKDPATIVHCAARDMIVQVRNNTLGAFVLLSYDIGALASFPNYADAYKLPAGACDRFVIAKGQGFYASTPSEGHGEISVAYFESIPTIES